MKPYVYKKKRKRLSRKGKVCVACFCIFTIFGLIFAYYFGVVAPIVFTLSEEKARSMSTIVVSESVAAVISEDNFTYDDLVIIDRNSSGDITQISTNSVNINKLVREVTKLVQENIDGITFESLEIALGTFTGIPFLYGIGPNISVKLIPVGTVNTAFSSSFQSAGINNTIHRLYFVITVNIGMLLPTMTRNFTTTLEVQICESILQGKVPDVFLQGSII